MADSSSVSTDATKWRRSPRDEQVSKKQKTELATFSDGKSLVTFLVGPGPTPIEFQVHKEVVCLHSDVLAAAFNGSLIEGQTQTYRLEDTTARAFRLFMQWLYSQKLKLTQTRPDYESISETDDKRDKLEEEEGMSLVELWVLADKFRMPVLQNAALDAMHLILMSPTGRIPTYAFEYIFKNTCVGSPLRKYTTKVCLEYVPPETLIACHAHFPRDLLFNMALKILQDKRDNDPANFKASDFHVK
ncbi:hypothetical protein ACEPPN_011930 [Leptodophora sp. 'Broadleaf-Isolate-01']